MYTGSQIMGTVHTTVIGFAAGGAGACQAVKLAKAQEVAETAVGIVNATKDIANGEANVWTALEFAPAAGFLLGKLGKAKGLINGGCFVAGTQVHIVADSRFAAFSPEVEFAPEGTQIETPVWFGASAALIVIGAAGTVRQQRRKTRETKMKSPRLTARDEFFTELPHNGLDSSETAACTHSLSFSPAGEKVAEGRMRGDSVADWSPDQSTALTAGLPVKNLAKHKSWKSAKWITACLILAAACLFQGLRSQPNTNTKSATAFASVFAPAQEQSTTKSIEQVRVGDAVIGDSVRGDNDTRFGTTVDRATWRKITLRAPKTDGSWADVELLRPTDWLESRNSQVGGNLDINVPEYSIHGLARVLAIDDCPPINTSGGRVVTGTFHHSSANILNIHIAGESQPIGTTANHPFWSADRQKMVRADELKPGESLRSKTGERLVVTAFNQRGSAPVFNIEVQCDRVYHVGQAGLLVHNGNDCLENGNFVYRALTEHDDLATGLRAKAPAVPTRISSHVMGKKRSEWISTTKDPKVAQFWNKKHGNHGVVRIDLDKINNAHVDVSKGYGTGRVYSTKMMSQR